MAGTYGVDEMKKVVGAVAEVLNVLSRFFHKGGVFTLFGLLEPIGRLKTVRFDVLKQELAELDAADRKAVEDEFKARLDLVDKAVQAKILAAVGYLDEAVQLVGEALGLVNSGIALVAKVKALLGA
jgi:hypothetical protein